MATLGVKTTSLLRNIFAYEFLKKPFGIWGGRGNPLYV